LLEKRGKKVTAKNIKRRLRGIISRIPLLGPTAIAVHQRLQLARRTINAKRAAANAQNLPNAETVYWVDPMRIRYHTLRDDVAASGPPEDRVFHPVNDKGKVVAGDWDQSEFRFDQLDVFQAIKTVIAGENTWPETSFYKTLLNGIDSGDNPWRINSQEDLDARCRYIDDLIWSIRENGYKLSHEISLPNEPSSLKKHETFGNEVSVNIGRDGSFLFQDGRHRLAIAQILGIPAIPVKVTVRHREWVEFRSFLMSLAAAGGGAGRHNKLYQPALHPDLADIEAFHSCEDRFDAIREHLDDQVGQMLDIGANLCYFCHRFEASGYDCIGVEYLPEIALAARRIRDAEGRKFKIYEAELFAATKKHSLDDIDFSVVIALNIFHHFLKRKETFDEFKSWLGKMNISQMFFESMKDAYVDPDAAEFVQFILDNSELNHSRLIMECDDGRLLYKLWR
jgi:hypothetical protein